MSFVINKIRPFFDHRDTLIVCSQLGANVAETKTCMRCGIHVIINAHNELCELSPKRNNASYTCFVIAQGAIGATDILAGVISYGQILDYDYDKKVCVGGGVSYKCIGEPEHMCGDCYADL